jgi:hypothetical protein
LQAELGDQVAILDQAPLLFRRERLVLLGSQENVTRIAAQKPTSLY